jgi:hypothetical protein
MMVPASRGHYLFQHGSVIDDGVLPAEGEAEMDLPWNSRSRTVLPRPRLYGYDLSVEAAEPVSGPGDRATSLVALVVCGWSLIEAPVEFVLYPDLQWLLYSLLFRLGLLMSGAMAINRVREFYCVFAGASALSGLTCVLWAALDANLPPAISALSVFDFLLDMVAALMVCAIFGRIRKSHAERAGSIDHHPAQTRETVPNEAGFF